MHKHTIASPHVGQPDALPQPEPLTITARREAEAVALGPLATPEDALRRLQRLGELAVMGMLPGAQASAAVRSCEAWLAAQRHLVSLQRVRALEARITELERELARHRERST